MASKENQEALDLLDGCAYDEHNDWINEKLYIAVKTIKKAIDDLQVYKKVFYRLCNYLALLSQDNTIVFEELKLGICFPEEHLNNTDGKYYMKKYLDKNECKESWLTAEQIEKLLLEEARKELSNEKL